MIQLDKHFRAIITIFTIVPWIAACGTFFGEATSNSSGDPFISLDSSAANFDASLNQELFRSFEVTNHTSGVMRLAGVELTGNVCQAFSLFSVSNTSGTVLMQDGQPTNITIPSGSSLFLNIRFQPVACSTANYDTLVQAYLADESGKLSTQAITLTVIGQPPATNTSEIVNCPEQQLTESNFEDTFLSGTPEPGEYYLMIDRMRAFIFPETATDQATLIGTDIGGLNEGNFKSPFLKIIVNKNNSFTLEKISACEDFVIPSAETDRFFLGADTLLTTNKAFSGSISNETETIFDNFQRKSTHVAIESLRIKLRADGIGATSLIEDPNTGIFQISIVTDLNTKQTEPDPNLGQSLQGTNGFFEGVLNREQVDDQNYLLKGLPLTDGSMILVGRGTFDNSDETFIGETETAGQFLIESTAYIYVQLEVVLMRKKGGP